VTEHSIDRVQLRQDIVSDGQEDYYGLYEVIWGLNSRYPEATDAAKREVSREVMTALVRAGEVVLYRTQWNSNTYEAVGQAEALGLVADPRSWELPSEQAYICYTAA
jgi:hypothetical protein